MVEATITPDGDVKPGQLPGGPAAIAVHAGPYEGLKATYDAIESWLDALWPDRQWRALGALPHRPLGRARGREVADRGHLSAEAVLNRSGTASRRAASRRGGAAASAAIGPRPAFKRHPEETTTVNTTPLTTPCPPALAREWPRRRPPGRLAGRSRRRSQRRPSRTADRPGAHDQRLRRRPRQGRAGRRRHHPRRDQAGQGCRRGRGQGR